MVCADKFGLGQDKSLGLLLQSVVVILAIIFSIYLAFHVYSKGMWDFIPQLVEVIAVIVLLVYSFISKNKKYLILALALFSIMYIIEAIFYFVTPGVAFNSLSLIYFIDLIITLAAIYCLYKDSKYSGYLFIAIFIVKIISEIVYMLFLGSSALTSILYCFSSLALVLTYYLR